MSLIVSGRFGFIVWANQSGRDGQLPASPSWQPLGIIRDVRVRVPAGTQVLRSVGSLAAAGITVVETALEAPEVTVTVEGVGMATKALLQQAKQRPANDPVFPYELPLLSVVFGRGNDAFRLVDAKIQRFDLNAPADRYVTASVTLVGRWVEEYPKPSVLPDIPTQVFTSKEGKFSYGEVVEARIRVNHRVDTRHTLKTTYGQRTPDHLVETVTEITGEAQVFWAQEIRDYKENLISPFTLTLDFVDWADANATMSVTLSGVKPREASLDIPVEREITGTVEFLATDFNIT